MADGCYKNPYVPASYKGVPFEAMEITTDVGRRIAKGEFPFSEGTAAADMGRKMRTYKLSARFVENNHVLQAGALILACESLGAGLLIHPTFGPVMVMCESASLKDNPLEEQGVSYVEMNFVEADAWLAGMNFGAAVFGIVITAIIASTQDNFEAQYRPNDVQFYYGDDVIESTSGAVNAVEEGFRRVTIGQTDIKVFSALAEMDTVRTDAGMLRDTDQVWKTLSLGMAAIDRYATETNKYSTFRSIANWAAKESQLSGIAEMTENSIFTTTRLIAAAYMSRALTERTPSSREQALREYDTVLAILNQEWLIAREQCNTALQLAIGNFSVQVSKALLQRAYDLPPSIQYNFSTGVHSLVAAYEIYGDARRVRDIQIRNNWAPAFNIGPVVTASV